MNPTFDDTSYRDLDQHLNQLAIAAQQEPPQSRARQRALARLIQALQQSKKLVRPRRDQFTGLYEEIYAEALQRLFSHICDKIDRYNPDRGEVLQWANFLLSRQFFIEASRELLPTVYKGLDPRSIRPMTLEDLDRSSPAEINPQLVPLPSQQVRDCLEEDPESLFQQAYIDRYPDANFQSLALKRLDGYSWEELATELDIKIPTLSSFYQRCLTKFAPNFRRYLS
ncbi:MAG: sigma-70 family RNA polymerase sigma factor [Leptolyngbyaceae cyanobacterium bins.302]|nr:sigma-70 family RNA polymerase sigma factor [Leptolyngbyaceae cyanobacterium bins.302]